MTVSILSLPDPDYFGSKNTNSIFTSANDGYKNLIGEKEVVGKSDFDFEFSVEEVAKDFYTQDRAVENELNTKSYLDVHYYADGLFSTLFIKKARKEGVIVKGTDFYGWKLSDKSITQLSILLSSKLSRTGKLAGQNSLEILNSFLSLNSAEYTILYLISLGYKPKQISEILNYTSSYIYNVISDIKLSISFNDHIKNMREYSIEELKIHLTIPNIIYENSNKFSKIFK